jgi:hypothetical protein
MALPTEKTPRYRGTSQPRDNPPVDLVVAERQRPQLAPVHDSMRHVAKTAYRG